MPFFEVIKKSVFLEKLKIFNNWPISNKNRKMCFRYTDAELVRRANENFTNENSSLPPVRFFHCPVPCTHQVKMRRLFFTRIFFQKISMYFFLNFGAFSKAFGAFLNIHGFSKIIGALANSPKFRKKAEFCGK